MSVKKIMKRKGGGTSKYISFNEFKFIINLDKRFLKPPLSFCSVITIGTQSSRFFPSIFQVWKKPTISLNKLNQILCDTTYHGLKIFLKYNTIKNHSIKLFPQKHWYIVPKLKNPFLFLFKYTFRCVGWQTDVKITFQICWREFKTFV